MSNSAQTSLRQRIRHLFREAKRRHVVQVTGVYLVAAWGLSTGAVDIFDVMGLPASASRYFVIALFALTPVVVIISWLFEADSTGIYRDHGQRPEESAKVAAKVAAETVFVSGNGPQITASYDGVTRTFGRDFTVGRDDECEFQLVDPKVSRRHARIELIEERWRVRDLGSANGTTINGHKVDTAWLEGRVSMTFYPDAPAFMVSTGADSAASTLIVEAGSS